MNHKEKLQELLQDVNSWNDLKVKLELFNTSQTDTTVKNTEAGKLFEYFAKYYFIIEPEQAQLYSNVWLYDEIPSDIKTNLNFPDRDFGIDLLLKDNQDRFIAVQCKFKNDEEEILQWSKDKIANPFALAEKCDSVMIFTNAADCVEEAKQREKFNLICSGHLLNTSAEVFSAIKDCIESNKPKVFEKYPRLAHQIKAVDKVVDYFNYHDRAQLILPCGAGKTLTALWIKEDLKSKNTLVLFPSLALLRQFKTEWANQRSEDYIYLNVCSEKDIDTSSEDSTVMHTYEISGEVTTSPERIREFLSHSDKSKIVFSTYQSIEATETALQFLPDFCFDLIICDEAHRTSGAKTATFAIVHDQERIKGKKRLYMTATPRVVSKNLKTRLGKDYDLLHDMSKPEIFGEEAFHMSFADAIPNILVDYKIIGIGVTHKQVKEFIEQRRYVTEKYDLKEIADNYALDIVMEKYSASHAITFHTYVDNAKDFSLRHNAFFSPDVYSRHISGEYTTSKRVKILKEFKEHQKGVVSNARCLTEGVDVPIIDLIYFCDPKNSKIDIVQASGRALRKDPNGKKTMGYIVVPIYHHIEDDIEKEIEKKPYFQNLIQIIRSLCDHDERLRAEIDDIAVGKGQKKSKRIQIDYNDLEIEKVIKLEGLDKNVRQFLFDQIIEKTKNNWNVRFEELKVFKEKYSTTDVSRKYNEEILRWWTQEQRNYYHKKDRRILTAERIKKLESIEFDWKGKQRLTYLPPDEKWKFNYEKLKSYFEENGDSDVPARYEKVKGLGTWVVNQRERYKNKKLLEDQIDLLERLNFNWKPKTSFVPKLIHELKLYKEKHGDVHVPTQSKLYPKLGAWVNKVRMIYRSEKKDDNGNLLTKHRGRLLKNEIDELNNLGFAWTLRKDNWDENFGELKEYFIENGHSAIKQSEDPNLYNWRYRQIKRQKSLSEEQRRKLATINFEYFINSNTYTSKPKIKRDDNSQQKDGAHEKVWNEMYERLKEFKLKNSNFFIPKTTKEDKQLSSWAITQRIARKKGKLSPERVDKLNLIEFAWTLPKGRKKINKPEKIKPLKRQRRVIIIKPSSEEKEEIKWLRMFDLLFSFVIKNGHTSIPRTSKENQRLAYWLIDQRKDFRAGKMPEEKIEKFKRINVNLAYEKQDGYNKIWSDRYNQLKAYFEKFGNSDVSSKKKEYKTLGTWVLFQRMYRKKGELSQERIELLDKLNFSWSGEHLHTGFTPNDDLWNERFEQLVEYKATFGHCNVSQLDKTYKKLGRWVNDQRVDYNRKELNQVRIDKLNEIGFLWEAKSSKNEALFNQRLKELIEYKKIYKDFKVPQKCKEFPKLGTWLSQIKFRGTSPEREQQLNEIGFFFQNQEQQLSLL